MSRSVGTVAARSAGTDAARSTGTIVRLSDTWRVAGPAPENRRRTQRTRSAGWVHNERVGERRANHSVHTRSQHAPGKTSTTAVGTDIRCTRKGHRGTRSPQATVAAPIRSAAAVEGGGGRVSCFRAIPCANVECAGRVVSASPPSFMWTIGFFLLRATGFLRECYSRGQEIQAERRKRECGRQRRCTKPPSTRPLSSTSTFAASIPEIARVRRKKIRSGFAVCSNAESPRPSPTDFQ